MSRDSAAEGPVSVSDAPLTSHAYREFLGHELRSPLTALLTALEALAGDRGENGGEAGPDRMLEIALRNARRLQDAVDWHQQVLELADVPPLIARRALTMDDLGRELAVDCDVVVEDAAVGIVVETDPHLVGAVTGQLVQACVFAGCGVPVRVRLTAAADGCYLGIETAPAPELPVSRWGLESRGEERRDDDLLRLASFLVPAAALRALGSRLESPADPGVPLRLRLDAAAGEPRTAF